MKRYKASMGLFLVFPVFVLAVILSYIIILYRHSYTYANLINIGLDIIILLYYFLKFCREVSLDSQGINFYTIFKKYRVEGTKIKSIRYSPFLTRILTDSGSFYILTTPSGGRVLKGIFKDYISH